MEKEIARLNNVIKILESSVKNLFNKIKHQNIIIIKLKEELNNVWRN